MVFRNNMFSDYIFYDGLLKEIKRNYTEKSLHLLFECRNKQEKWLLLQVVCSGIAFCRIEEHNGNQEILSEPLRVPQRPMVPSKYFPNLSPVTIMTLLICTVIFSFTSVSQI